jgi:3-oxoacyl-[acyl-carrier protein] reductase
MHLGLRGKRALVIGASRGIGWACAEVLAEEGCDVVLVSRTAAELETARAVITRLHNVAVGVFPLDLPSSGSVDARADTEILVDNAGAIPRGTIAEIDDGVSGVGQIGLFDRYDHHGRRWRHRQGSAL